MNVIKMTAAIVMTVYASEIVAKSRVVVAAVTLTVVRRIYD